MSMDVELKYKICIPTTSILNRRSDVLQYDNVQSAHLQHQACFVLETDNLGFLHICEISRASFFSI